MGKKGYAVIAVIVGIAALYGVYQFQANRITPGDIEDMRTAQARLAAAKAPQVGVNEADLSLKAATYPKPEEVGDAPARYRVQFTTTAGDFVVEVHRDWAPLGANRFYKLVKTGFFDKSAFFRVVPGYVVQFGLSANGHESREWREMPLQDEPVKTPNTRGTICFAKSGPNTRTTQLFINLGDNSDASHYALDSQGFAPFGEVVQGMESVDNITDKYGEQPEQGQIMDYGNQYLLIEFPGLDFIRKAEVVAEGDSLPPLTPTAPPAAEAAPPAAEAAPPAGDASAGNA